MLTIENRGMALSDPVSGRWTTSKMAQDALFVLDHLNWKSQIHVVGLSMGGMIAQEVCKLGKGRFASLTLLSTIAGGFYSLGYFLYCLPSGVQLTLRANLSSSGQERLKHTLRIMYPDSFLQSNVPHPTDPNKTITNFDIFRKTLIRRALEEKRKGIPVSPVSSVIKQIFAVSTHNVTLDQLAEISKSVNGNVLVVTGDEDILVHMANSRRLHEGLKGELMIFKGAGHGAFEQCANEVNAAIEKLVLKASKSAPTQARL